jgi:putative transcriptional regulator
VPVGLNQMSKDATSKFVRYSSNNLPPGKTDWAKVKAMTDEEVHAAALSDPDAQPMTAEQLARMRPALPQTKKKRRAR